jgi:hypothetical protein
MNRSLNFFEIALVRTTQGADPILRQIFKGGVGLDAAARIAFGGVVNVVTDHTAILGHAFLLIIDFLVSCFLLLKDERRKRISILEHFRRLASAGRILKPALQKAGERLTAPTRFLHQDHSLFF